MLITQILHGLSVAVIVYFLMLNTAYLVLLCLSFGALRRHKRVTEVMKAHRPDGTEFYKPVSVVVPAHNEEATIVHTVSSVLGVHYPELEIIVVNDGSTDGTFEELKQAFDLVPSIDERDASISTAHVKGVWDSLAYPNLRVVDKEQGGKADALNAGINASSFPLVCNIDADSVIDAESLIRITRPFLTDHRVVAVGGVVRLANDCCIEGGHVQKVNLPKRSLARFQTIEYLRAFLFGRVGWSRINTVMIISGAFAIFRRTALIEVNGYNTDTVGEDMELVLRMHRLLTGKGKPYRIVFVPDPICWTQVPEDLRSLGRQRRRWQRGLAESLAKNTHVLFNPRYGSVGMVGYPFFFLFELLSPAIELGGYLVFFVAAALGVVGYTYALAFFVCAVLLGTLISVCSLLLEELSFRTYGRLRDVVVLSGYALLENLGYRQLLTVWRFLGAIDFCRGRRSWGQAARRAF